MRIAVDIMGGDKAPREIVAGCVDASRRLDELPGVEQIVMVGREEAMREELARCKASLGDALGFVAAFGAFQIPRQIIALMRDRRRRRFNEQLVEALGQVSNALKAGFSITQAFETVVQNGENPIAQEFEVFLQQQRVGVSFQEALDNLNRRVGSEDLELVCGAMDISRKTGGNLTEVFDKISQTIRERTSSMPRIIPQRTKVR